MNKVFFAILFSSFVVANLVGQTSVFQAIQNNSNLQVFEEAVITAGLRADFSSNQNVFTIFAPSNAAMNTIPSSIRNNPTAIREIILTHSLSAYYSTLDLIDGAVISTINNRNLSVDRNGNEIFINNNVLIQDDIFASNGIVHVIDQWIPKSRTTETTLWSIIQNSSKHTVLETIIKEADLESQYLQDDLRTVFAPIDSAFFHGISDERLALLLGDNVNYINNNLLYHMVGQDILFEDLDHDAQFTALNSQTLTITIQNTRTFVNNAKIRFSAVTAVNGRVYTIEKVLFPEDIPPFTFVDFVNESEDHTILENAIISADLTDELSAEGSNTFFAPTDDAFDLLGEDLLLDLFANPDSLESVLRNHILSTRHIAEDLEILGDDVAINGYPLTFEQRTDGLYVNDSRIEISDIIVDNGIVHVIDAVLIEIIEPFTVNDILLTHDQLTQYNFYVQKDTYGDTLDQGGPFTVFAPSDDAIAMMPPQFIEDLNSVNPTLLDELVRSHIVRGLNPRDSLNIDRDFIAINDFGLTVGQDSLSNLFLNQSGITVTDLLADNGVVHIIDAVVNPQDTFITIYDFVRESDDHGTLETLLRSSNLVNIYDSPGNLTMLAPTDEAFDNLPSSVFSEIINDPSGLLVDLILRHTLQQDLTASEIEALAQVINSNGETLDVNVISGEIFIDDAKIIVEDVLLANGIVHVIDAVIGQAEVVNSVFDVIANSENHEQLETFLLFADLDDELMTEQNISYFAPTDNAFAALPIEILNQLGSTDPSFLIDVLNFHKHNNIEFSNTFFDGRTLLMANGQETTLTLVGTEFYINNAQIVFEDIVADNGVVHIVDAVIMEPVDLLNVYEIISNESDLGSLKKAVDASSLDDELSTEVGITIFAPTDQAFEALPAGVLDELLANTSDLLDVILNHKHNSYVEFSDLNNGERLVMANGDEVTVIVKSNGTFINNAQIIVEDLFAENGVVHKIDAVLYTPPVITTTVFDVINTNESLSFLKDAVLSAGLKSNLEADDKLTLFAPTNDAFNALPNDLLTGFLNDPTGELQQVLLGHIFLQELRSTNFANGQNLMMASGNSSVITLGNGIYSIDGSVISVVDQIADNGVVHIIDAVISLPITETNTVYDIIVESTSHTILENAINLANLSGALSGSDFNTVFAPTDAAFNTIPIEIWTQLMNDPTGMLRDVLLGHVLSGQVFSSNFVNNGIITMSNGSQAVITINGNSIFINNAEIIISDIPADNGVVHVIDAVLLSEGLRTTVFEVIVESPDHTVFEELVILAGLEPTLSSNSLLTVFAPNDNAFNSLDPQVLMDLKDDPSGLLRSVLLYHITAADIPFASFVDGQQLVMANGQTATITKDVFNTFIQDGWIQGFDLTADNGRVHVLNKLISPSTNLTELLDNQFRIYPNPTADELYLDLIDQELKIKSLSIFNNLGQVVLTSSVNALGNRIDVSNLSPGVYYISLDGYNSNKLKFIKN